MKKLIEVSLKSIHFLYWMGQFAHQLYRFLILTMQLLWRFFAELIPFLAIVVMSVIFWFVRS